MGGREGPSKGMGGRREVRGRRMMRRKVLHRHRGRIHWNNVRRKQGRGLGWTKMWRMGTAAPPSPTPPR